MQKGGGLCRDTEVMRNDVGNGYEQQKYRKMKLFLMQWLTGRMMCQLQPETVEISEQSTSM